MGLARDAAPEIDRLVLSVNRGVAPRHGARLGMKAREVGLDSIDLLPHFEDFLLRGTLTPDLAVVRMRYRPPESVLARLEELEGKGLIGRRDAGLAATEPLRHLLEAMLAARADVAAAAWSGHEGDVATAAGAARRVAAAATAEHVVAAAHRALPEPDDQYLRLEHRLMTLRYIRQHDHAAAWLARGRTAAQMVVLSKLWMGDDVTEDSPALAPLVDGGLAEIGPPRLTAAGIAEREAIERDTNARAQRSYDVLDDESARSFLAALRRLPGVPDED